MAQKGITWKTQTRDTKPAENLYGNQQKFLA